MDYRGHPKIVLAARHLRAGGVVAYPTEGVWGLGADPFNREAVEKILDLKGRSVTKGLILVAAHIHQFDFILDHLSSDLKTILTESWPGPHTWLVPHHHQVPSWVVGQHDTVALRVSAHPLVKALTLKAGPLVSTSANPQGLIPAQNAQKVRQYFGNRVFFAPGQIFPNAKPSSIRDLISGQWIRV